MHTTEHKMMFILLTVMFGALTLAHADIIYLKNGGSVSGIIEKEDNKNVEVNTGFGTVTFKKTQIKNIKRSGAEESRKIAEAWQKDRIKLRSKEKEFEEARDRRFEGAYEYRMEDAKAKKAKEGHFAKQINIAREPGGKGIIVEVLLNNSVKTSLALDTGASLVVLSRKVGEELGVDLSDTNKNIMEMLLANGRRATAKAIILDSVKIQDVEVKNVRAAIMLDQVPAIGVTEGLLGMSFLSNFDLKTDLKSMKMTLEKIE